MDDSRPVRVRVVYGTSQHTTEVSATEFLIRREDSEAFKLSGLAVTTKFCFHNVAILQYTDLWFTAAPATPPKPNPIMGSLHASLVKTAERAFRASQSPARP